MNLTKLALITTATTLLFVGCGMKHHAGVAKDSKNQAKKEHRMPKDPAVKAAMMECLETVPKGENNRPNREAMKSCMKEKGFEKPEGKRK
ncbi:MAG: Unknown protein [uncultured Sulfurovum sp.]|uniref:Uncharacterized protein n=1 Tax=uncultured Sulfurovum sp. TaxID=269237 RepID=A0A6S6SRV8_9BACT|nr:MAG: Unknown protein [uncultured Sulfurovum sp.]